MSCSLPDGVVEAAKEVAKDAADVVDRYVVKPAVKAVSKVKEEVSKRYQHVKTHVKQKVREVNDRYVKPAREKAATALKTAREGITKAADWVQEHKDTVAMVAGGWRSGGRRRLLWCDGRDRLCRYCRGGRRRHRGGRHPDGCKRPRQQRRYGSV